MEISDQINLLIKKPTGKISNIERTIIRLFITQSNKVVVTDACLAVQLGLKEYCGLGKEFIHIKPNGEIDDCCYKNDCFLYKDMKANIYK